jgi:hypothetical protein
MGKKVSVKKKPIKAKGTNKRPPVELLPVNAMLPAEWNYKERGTPEMIQKLARSIERDKSLGVVAVREVKKGKYEVIDGNHRLEAARLLNLQDIYAENFGPISKAEAVIISRRRNHQWFKDDAVMLGALYAEVVVPEISLEELDGFMPETRQEIDDLLRMADGGLPDMLGKEDRATKESQPDPTKRDNIIRLTGPQYEVVMRSVEAIRRSEQDASIPDGRAVELICADFLSGLIESED